MTNTLQTIFDSVVRNIGIIALIMSSLVIVINLARDAFDVDPKPRSRTPPIGGAPIVYYEYRYMSDHAESCRDDLLHFIRVFRHVINGLLAAVLVSFLFNGLFVSDPFPYTSFHEAGLWWTANVKVMQVLRNLVSPAVLLFGPLIVWKITDMTYRLFRAKAEFAKYKDWWSN